METITIPAAVEVAEKAVSYIENLIVEMLDGDYADNEVAIGRLLCGSSEVQVQLKITRTPSDFIEDGQEDLIPDSSQGLSA